MLPQLCFWLLFTKPSLHYIITIISLFFWWRWALMCFKTFWLCWIVSSPPHGALILLLACVQVIPDCSRITLWLPKMRWVWSRWWTSHSILSNSEKTDHRYAIGEYHVSYKLFYAVARRRYISSILHLFRRFNSLKPHISSLSHCSPILWSVSHALWNTSLTLLNAFYFYAPFISFNTQDGESWHCLQSLPGLISGDESFWFSEFD